MPWSQIPSLPPKAGLAQGGALCMAESVSLYESLCLSLLRCPSLWACVAQTDTIHQVTPDPTALSVCCLLHFPPWLPPSLHLCSFSSSVSTGEGKPANVWDPAELLSPRGRHQRHCLQTGRVSSHGPPAHIKGLPWSVEALSARQGAGCSRYGSGCQCATQL